jgi:hypothetical protein
MWVTFRDGTGGYVEAEDANTAMSIAKEKTGKEPVKAEPIPYPARPVIFQGPGHPKYGPCPPFCYTPKQCVNRGACPHAYACSE